LWGHKARLGLAEPEGPQQGVLLSERLALGRRGAFLACTSELKM
jgi:hypothetical protein